MKYAILFLTLIFSVSCSMQTVESQKRAENPQTATPSSQSKQPVLVELFTSEGCSSCPSADQTLTFLEKEQPYGEAEIITLSLHVDYWDYIGWKDKFSSAAFSARQTVYADKLKVNSTYTPQMIVDGQTQFVGSDSGKAANAIMAAAKIQKAKVGISSDSETLKINISDLPKHENAGVFVAIAESKLISNVRRGENSGKILEHTSVVRELKEIGRVKSSDAKFETETKLQISPSWKKENLKVVIFVQENESRRVLGIARVTLE